MINICIILMLITGSLNGQNLDNDITMVTDIVNSYDRPTTVLVYDCWKTSKKMKLVTKLSDTSLNTIQFIQNIDMIDNIYEKKDLLIVVDLNCPSSGTLLKSGHDLNKFGKPYRWLIIDKITDSKKVPSELNELNILLDSEVMLSQRDGTNFTLILLYKLQSHSKTWNLESFGIWTSRGLFKTKHMQISLPIRRKNLNKLPIGVSVVISSETTKIDLLTLQLTYRDLHVDFISKTTTLQVNPLFDFMNATRVLVFTDNWGYIVNGTFNGMIGDLVRGAADLTGTVIFITKPRLSVLEYLSYPSPATVMFVFRQPSLSYQNNLFVLPFKPKVWLCLSVVIMLMMFIIFVNAQWESVKLENYDAIDRTSLTPSFGEIAMMIIGAVTQQGSFTELKGTLGRVVMFFMFLLFLFLYTSYSANIVALLQSSSNEIKTLADLLHSKLDLGVEDTPYNRHHFSTATEPVRKAIYENKIAPRGSKPNFMSLEDGVKKLQKKPFAFNMFVGGGYRIVERYFLEHEKCGLQEIGYIQENKPWVTCRKESPYKEIYKIGYLFSSGLSGFVALRLCRGVYLLMILRLRGETIVDFVIVNVCSACIFWWRWWRLTRNHEHGLDDRVNRLIYRKKPSCIVHGGIFDSVNMTDFYPALLMLVYGTVLAGMFLVLEILHFKRTNG